MSQGQTGSENPQLVPLTPEARSAVRGSRVDVTQLPFRVGRDLRNAEGRGVRLISERRSGRPGGPNDLYLFERGPRHRLSREHFLLGRNGGDFYVEDRRSACGTLVGGERLGGARRGGRRALRDGEIIIAGGSHSPFIFRFVVAGREAISRPTAASHDSPDRSF